MTITSILAPLLILFGLPGQAPAAPPPHAELANRHIAMKLYLPDATNGFYRGTRFDWAGVIASLEYKGHNYFGPWFTRSDPAVRDFVYDGPDIIASPGSAMTGPAEEFTGGAVLGFAEAAAGGTFIKIGVGVLRKPDDASYSPFRNYPMVDPGKWTVRRSSDAIVFTHQLSDPSSGHGYVYEKTVRLIHGAPAMALEHVLKNTGRRTIEGSVYNHNFLVLDRQPTGPDFSITVPFKITTTRPPDPALAEIRGHQVVFRKRLENQDRVMFPLEGYGAGAKDYDIRIENSRTRAGMRITADRPMTRLVLWSIRSVLSMEPFIGVSVEPGSQFTWKMTYSFYTLPGVSQR